MRRVARFGDGWMTVGGEPEVVEPKLAGIAAGAKKAGRSLPGDFHTAYITTSCLLGQGDKLTDDRVIDETCSWVICELEILFHNV